MTSGQTVLVLDDDSTFVAVLGKALRNRGYHVLCATTIAQALEQSASQLPQLAVIDLKIEQESGLEIIVPLLTLNPQMRILILTGYSSIATAVSAIKTGAWDYACKPLDADEILVKLGQDKSGIEKTEVADQPLSVDRLEWEHIQRVLIENDGNISATARSLGMYRRTLQRKLQKRPVRQ